MLNCLDDECHGIGDSGANAIGEVLKVNSTISSLKLYVKLKCLLFCDYHNSFSTALETQEQAQLLKD